MDGPGGAFALFNLYCNTPSCPLRASLKSEKEKDLIDLYKKKKMFKCSKCKCRYYCSTECQHADWKAGHKEECAKIVSYDAIRTKEFVQSTETAKQLSERMKEEDRLRLPALAMEAYVPKAFPKGEVVSGARKVNKVMRELPVSVRMTAQIVITLCTTHTIMSDKFDRLTKGLPPRGDDFLYNTNIDFHGNTTEEMVEEWVPSCNKFKTWMWRASGVCLSVCLSDLST